MPYRFRVVAGLFALVVIMYLDRLCIAVAGPRIQSELQIGPVGWGWVIGVFTLAYALFEVPTGALGDRIGPRRVLTRIVLWWSAFTSATGAVGGYWSLLAVRFLFGAGEAGAFPNATAVLSRWIPLEERGRANCLFWIATSAGGAITPLVVVPIQQSYGWRAAFHLFAALGVIWAALWYFWFRDRPSEHAGITAAELAHIGVRAAPVHAPVNWRVVLRDPNFRRLLLMYHAYCWGAYFYLSWLHTYLQVGLGLTEDQMRVASALPASASVIGILAGGFLSDRLLRRYSLRVARCSIGSVGLFLAGICMLAASVTPQWRVAVALLTAGLGFMGLMLPIAWAVCLDMGRDNAGAISGAMNMAGQAGSFISSVVFGYLVQWFGRYDFALAPLAAMLFLSGYLFARIDPSRQLAGLPGAPVPDLSLAGSR